MTEVTPISSRKTDHIQVNLEQDVRSGLTTGLEKYRFIHQALPELDLGSIETTVRVFGKTLCAPLLISSMTGGTNQAATINRNLAMAAQHTGVAMALGSQRAGIEHPELAGTFQVRQYAPDILLLANLGAVQLNYQYDLAECRAAVDMIEADGLILHLNPLQEALQPEGDHKFSGLAMKIEHICTHLPIPVIVKEVGWGISETAARLLASAGVAAIDVAGAGGTSWSQVEMHRARNDDLAQVAAAFHDWGITTSESIAMVHQGAPGMLIFASGGLRDGIDIAKCLALGASLGGMAGPLLKAAVLGVEETINVIESLIKQLQVCMFAAGLKDVPALQQTRLLRVD